jgi:soluble lytic murein transglycosylase
MNTKPDTLQTTLPATTARFSGSTERNLRLHKPFALYAVALLLSLMLSKNELATASVAAAVSSAATSALSSASSFISSAVAGSPLNAADRDFVSVHDTYERRDSRALDAARARYASSAYPLAPYVTYWWHSVNLIPLNNATTNHAVAKAGEIGTFLDANVDTPYADTLRRDWLKTLGGQDAWDVFAIAQNRYVGDDSEVTCHQWRFRLSRNDRDVLSEIRAAWNSGKHTSDNCYQAFLQAAKLQPLTLDEVWGRVRLAFERNQSGEAMRVAGLLTGVPANFNNQVNQAALSPSKFMSTQKVSPPKGRANDQANGQANVRAFVEPWLFAVTRQARDDPSRAAELLAKHGAALAPSDRAYAWAQVGLYGAIQHDANAVTWFRQAQTADATAPLNDLQAAWKARASMRAGDWESVRSAILAMSATEQRENAWRYWLARAHEKTGKPEAAKPLRESLTNENSFYGVLAAEELGVPPSPAWRGYKPVAAELERIAARPGIQRALTFYKLEMKGDALREWQSATRGLSDQELLAAADIARQANAPDRAINAADRTAFVHDFSSRFPMPHRNDLQPSARANRLDEAWVYGLIRQESRFMADVRSSAGAMGLMQLMPATAKWVAKQSGVKDFAANRVVDVPTNLQLGSYYLRHVLDDLGHPVLATAAYNAGPGRARRWRAETALEGAIYAESIPFNETRDYVKKVMANAWYYSQQIGMPRVSLRDMMGTVASKNGRDGVTVTRSALDAKDTNGAELGIFGLAATAVTAPPAMPTNTPVVPPAITPTTSPAAHTPPVVSAPSAAPR